MLIYLTSYYYLTQAVPQTNAAERSYALYSNDSGRISASDLDRAGDEPLAKRRGKGFTHASTTNSSEPPKGVSHWMLLLFGLPAPQRVLSNSVSLIVNALLSLAVLDLVFRAPTFYPSTSLSFARVGYVDAHTAKLLVREPAITSLPLSISYQSSISTGHQTPPAVRTLHSDTDYTGSFTLTNLHPSTTYVYNTSNGHSGSFTTSASIESPITTNNLKLTFLTTSCIKPHFPYNPFAHPLRIPGLDHLSRLLPSLQASFMLFLGDFIYIDVPLRMGSDLATYRREYRQVYASPSWPGVSQDLPWLHVIDDHEIANDWDQGLADPYPAAVDPFLLYHHAANPQPVHANTTYYSFINGPASFFLLDTRRYRDLETGSATDPHKSMLGAQQLAAVKAWLARPEPAGVRWKFLASSVPLTRNWRVNARDTWSGYLAERQALLEAMWDAAGGDGAYGVVVLSGDRHEFAAPRFPAPVEQLARDDARRSRWTRSDGAPAAVHEFSCSPLSMFYLPFPSYWENPGESSGFGVGGEDQQIAYIPKGNSKVGAVSIDGTVGGGASRQSTLEYRLFVDGSERWRYALMVD